MMIKASSRTQSDHKRYWKTYVLFMFVIKLL